MYPLIRQAYRHLIQQAIVRQEIRLMQQARTQSAAWETGGVAALFSAAAVCGALAQAHLG